MAYLCNRGLKQLKKVSGLRPLVFPGTSEHHWAASSIISLGLKVCSIVESFALFVVDSAQLPLSDSIEQNRGEAGYKCDGE